MRPRSGPACPPPSLALEHEQSFYVCWMLVHNLQDTHFPIVRVTFYSIQFLFCMCYLPCTYLTCSQWLPIAGWGWANRPPSDFSDLYQKLFALAPWNLGTFPNHSLGVLCQNFDFLPWGGCRAIFAEVLFAELRVFRHFPPISALLRLATAIDDIHRNSYALTTRWRHFLMFLEPPMLA